MSAAPSQQVGGKEWLALVGVMLGAFMAVLDIQITNSSLKDISGALGSSTDEGSWISTAYLVAEIVVIGTSGIFAGIFSTKRYLLFSATGFVFFSIMCAFAHDLTEMVVFRACQGLTGGALIPLAFNVILTLLPPAKQPIGMSIFGLTATFGPSIGPTIGGYLTDTYGWQWIFFVNLVPGALMIALIWLCLPTDKMHLERLRDFDYIGVLCMAIGLGSLEFVLEEGERKDWFGNVYIVRFAWLAIIFITLFIFRELTARKPFLNFNIFLDRSFTLSSIIMTCLGLGLYGIVYLLPLYLGQVQGYNATEIGLTVMWIGLPQLLIIPFIPKLLKIFDVRLILGMGVIFFSISCFMNSYMDPDYARPQLTVSNIVRALGQPLILIPLLSTSTVTIARRDAGSASALINMLRNLGGSIGIAMLSTLVTWREHLHSSRINSGLTAENPLFNDRVSQLRTLFMQGGLDPTTAQASALKLVSRTVSSNAYIMAYSDCFYVIGIIILLAGVSIFFLPNIQPKGHAAVA